MKIAVFHNLPSGGAKRAFYGFIKYLAKTGCIIHVFIPSTAEEKFLSSKKFAEKVVVLPVHKTINGIINSSIRYVFPIRKFNFNIVLADLENTQKKTC